MLYEFDTGGPGFWAAYTRDPGGKPGGKKGQWWGNFDVVVGEENQFEITYRSGVEYVASEVTATVDLYKSESGTNKFTKLCGSQVPLGIAQINQASSSGQKESKCNWEKALKTGKPPLFCYFYGDFGAALYPSMNNSGTAAVYSVLPQIVPNGLTNGFIVHVGALGKQTHPTLQLGLTQEDIQSFKQQFSMNPNAAAPQQFNVFPGTSVAAYSEAVVNAQVEWALGDTRQLYNGLGLTIDTGAPATTFWQDSVLTVEPQFLRKNAEYDGAFYTGKFKSGVKMSVHPEEHGVPGDLDWNFKTGQKLSVNQVTAGVSKNTSLPLGYMNTGLMFYTSYDVMFDLQNGNVGFRPVR